MPHLRSIALPRSPEAERFRSPCRSSGGSSYSTSALVTFLVGENDRVDVAGGRGRGTSDGGSESLSETTHRRSENGWRAQADMEQRVRRGFFLRAEDFFGFTKSLSKMRADLQARLGSRRTVLTSSIGRKGCEGPCQSVTRRHGASLQHRPDANSHGRAFSNYSARSSSRTLSTGPEAPCRRRASWR